MVLIRKNPKSEVNTNYHIVIDNIFSSLEVDEEGIHNRANCRSISDFISTWEHALKEFDSIENACLNADNFTENCYKQKCSIRLNDMYQRVRYYIGILFTMPAVGFDDSCSKNKRIKKKYEKLEKEAMKFYYDYKMTFYSVADELRFKMELCTKRGLIESFERDYKYMNTRYLTRVYAWEIEQEMLSINENMAYPIDKQLWGRRFKIEYDAYDYIISNRANDFNNRFVLMLGKRFMDILAEERNVLVHIKKRFPTEDLFDYKSLLADINIACIIVNPMDFIYLIYRLNYIMVKIHPELEERHDNMLGIEKSHENLEPFQNKLKTRDELYLLLKQILDRMHEEYKDGLSKDKYGQERGRPYYNSDAVIKEIKCNGNNRFNTYDNDKKNLAKLICIALETKSIGKNIIAKDIAMVAHKYVKCKLSTLETYISKAKLDKLK